MIIFLGCSLALALLWLALQQSDLEASKIEIENYIQWYNICAQELKKANDRLQTYARTAPTFVPPTLELRHHPAPLAADPQDHYDRISAIEKQLAKADLEKGLATLRNPCAEIPLDAEQYYRSRPQGEVSQASPGHPVFSGGECNGGEWIVRS